MDQTIIDGIESYGYGAILLFLLLETVFPPLPSEVILLTAGVAVAKTDMNGLYALLSATAGSYFGALILYTLGRVVPLERLKASATDGYMGKVGMNYNIILRMQRIFHQKGRPIVFFGRFIPVIRSLISIPAGMAKMDLPSFSLFTILGSAFWNGLNIYIGYRAGDSWRELIRFFKYYSNRFLIILLIILGGFIWYRRRKK